MLYDQEYVDYLPASITIGTNIYWAFYLIGIISLLLICNFHKTFMTIVSPYIYIYINIVCNSFGNTCATICHDPLCSSIR